MSFTSTCLLLKFDFVGSRSLMSLHANTAALADILIFHSSTKAPSWCSPRESPRGEQSGADQNSDFADIWKLKIPAKSAVFAWRLIRDRLPTKLNLSRRQVMVNDLMCPFCGRVEEEAAHLFFNCNNILPLWWESLSWVDLVTTLPQNPKDNYLQHVLGFAEGKKLKRWRC